jgi:hypothetical protein
MKMEKLISKFGEIICLLIIIAVMNSCVVNKPDANNVTSPDYNTRRTVTTPHYHKKMSPIGISVTIGVPAICAAVAYNSSLITYQSGETRKSVKPANAAIGALIGYSITSLVNYSFGLNKTTSSYDNNEWLSKANKNLIIVPNSLKQNQFIAISPSSEFSFKIKTIQDARDFKSAFPNSNEKDNIVKKSIDNCMRSDLPELINLFPDSKFINEAKTAYIERSSTFYELAFAVNQYPEININTETMFVGFVRNIDQAIQFIHRYPNSVYKKSAVISSFITPNQSIFDIKKLKESYPDDFFLTPSDEIVKSNDDVKKNYLNALYTLKSPSSIVDLETFYNEYSWLNYYGKADDVIQNYWNIANSTIEDGNFIIYLMKDISTNETYKNWGVSEYSINSFLNGILYKELKYNVTIKSTNHIGSTSDEWDKWCNNNSYSAGLVSQKGKIQYILYGEVQNKSKFDLPVLIKGGSDLYKKSELQGTGFISNIFAKISNAYGSNNTIVFIANASNNFYIPTMPSKTTTSFAIMLDFGEGTSKSGVNFMDWVKMKTEVYLANAYVQVEYNNGTPSNSVLKEQEKWLYFAQNGLPNTPLTDLYRGEEVKDSAWNEKHAKILEARRRAAIEYQNRINNAKASGSCYELVGPIDVDLYTDYKITGYKIKCKTYGEFVIFKLSDEIMTSKIGFLEWYDSPGWYKYKSGLFIKSSKRIASKDKDFEKVANDLCGCN